MEKNIAKEIAAVAKDYQYHDPPGALVWLQELISNILRAISEFLSLLRLPIGTASDSRAAASFVQYLVVGIGIICAICLVLVIAGRLRHIAAAKKLAQAGLIDQETILDRRGWREQGEQLAAAGKHREAVRALYMSALYWLDEQSIIAFAPTKTNYEYFYSIKDKTRNQQYLGLDELFASLVDRVETIWFGFAEVGAEDFSFCLDKLSEMERLKE